jgi:hypothetical protein
MRYQQCLSLLALLGVLWTACKKDKDAEPPSITIIAPGDASTLTVPDTLLVTVTTSDDQGVEQVAVSLLDADNVPVTVAVSATPSSDPATITLALPVTSEQLESGTYKVLATATDGELSAKDIHSIQVTAAPLRLRAIFGVATPAAGTVALYRIDSLGQTALASTFAMDLGGAAISSSTQRLFIVGSTTGPLLALSVNDLGTRWQRPNLSPVGAPWFTSADLCADGQLYVGDDNGTLHAYQAFDGTGTLNAVLPTGFRTEQAITVDDLLLCTVRQFVTQEQRLALFQRSSGAQQGTQTLNVVPVGLFERDADHVLVFGNHDGEGHVQDRNIVNGGSWEAYAWPSTVTAVEQVGTGTWIVALANGDLQRFTYDNTGSLSIGNTAVLHDLAYDPVSGAVLAGTDGQVLAIDPANGTVVASYPMNGPVRKVLPLLNR